MVPQLQHTGVQSPTWCSWGCPCSLLTSRRDAGLNAIPVTWSNLWLQGCLLENENLTLWLLIKRVWKMCQQDKIFPFCLKGSSDVNLKCSLQLPYPAQLLRIFTDYIKRRKRIWDFIAVSLLTVRNVKTQLVLTLHTHLPMEIPTCGEEKKGKDQKLLKLPLIHAQTQRKQKIQCQTLLGATNNQQSQQTTSVLNTTFLHITANYNRTPSYPWNKICNILIISMQSREAVLLSSF